LFGSVVELKASQPVWVYSLSLSLKSTLRVAAEAEASMAAEASTVPRMDFDFMFCGGFRFFEPLVMIWAEDIPPSLYSAFGPGINRYFDFARIFSEFPDNDARYADLSANCTIGGLMGFGIALWATRYRIVLYSDMPPELVKTAGVIPAATPEEALAKGFELAGEEPDVVIMPHGSVTFPILKQ